MLRQVFRHAVVLALVLSATLGGTAGLAAGWEKKVFKGETVYARVVDEGRPALKAESRATASALIYRVSLDPKALGFSLREIGDLLSLHVDRTTTCPEVRKRAEAKIADIESKIETLLGMKRALEKLTAACRKRQPTGDCPILTALGDE